MDLFEKINRSFGSWYEGLFGGGGDDVRPKDILRRILAAMEDNRKEGFDNRVYVPNQYVLEINVHDDEEKDYLLSFLDRGELESAIRRYCKQNNYVIRGALDFTIKEVDDPELNDKRGEKVRVRCRYNTKITGPETASPASAAEKFAANGSRGHADADGEDRTVASVSRQMEDEEGGTVPAVTRAALVVYAPDRPPFRYGIARGNVTIGRSKSGNDLTVDNDGQISKRHARIELDADGKFTVYDLGSTNGTKVNGRRVENRTLNDGDEILVGTTRLVFQQARPAEMDMEAPVDNEEESGTVANVETRTPAATNGPTAAPTRSHPRQRRQFRPRASDSFAARPHRAPCADQ